MRDRDASGPETALTDVAPAFYGVPSVEALAAHVYSKPLTKSEIAAFAVETAKLAEQGDDVARALYRSGARGLAEQIVAVIDTTGLADGQRAFPVGLIGSVFKAGALFVEPIVHAVNESAPQARVSVVEAAPVAGSLLLAARACGRSDAPEPGELARLIGSALAGIG